MYILRFAAFVLLLTASAASLQAAPVNVNTASADEIAQALKGIGLKKAGAIVAFRSSHGDYKNKEALVQVKGIGKKTVEKNRSDILLSD